MHHIFSGIRKNVIWETRLDLTVDAIGDLDGKDFFRNNSGKDKDFSMVP